MITYKLLDMAQARWRRLDPARTCSPSCGPASPPWTVSSGADEAARRDEMLRDHLARRGDCVLVRPAVGRFTCISPGAAKSLMLRSHGPIRLVHRRRRVVVPRGGHAAGALRV